jgi:hypothetical protein
MKIIKISKKSIEQIASELRNELTIDPDDDQITAMCLQVSRELKKRLISNGYEAIVVQGVFEVDSPDVAYSEMDSDLFESEEEMEDAMHHPLHYWVEAFDGNENLIVDITADQFNDELESEEMPPVFIDSLDSIRYTSIRKDWI